MLAKLFKRDEPAIEKGGVYRRVRTDRTVETAKVLSLYNDSFGIPHVRYQVVFGRVDGVPHHDGQRMLSVDAFMRQYGDRMVHAAAH
ncbi:MAG TPA: hypothetical protein VFS04_11275 [Alphaproteobacteria bacterium]|nr:hypothetical protein [Alphaproteobacteria bacterium]